MSPRIGVELEFLERAFDPRADAVAAFDHDLRFLYWNDAMEAVSQVPRRVALHRGAYELFPQLLEPGRDSELRAALSGEYRFADTPFFAAADPHRSRNLEWFVLPLQRASTALGGALIARANAEAVDDQLSELEARFRTMADNSPVLLWTSETDSLCSFFNQTWLDFSGRTLEEELGVGWAEGVHPEDFERCMRTYMDAFARREPFEMEYRLRRHDGRYRWMLDRGNPRFTQSGRFEGFIGSCVDITDRREAEARAQRIAEDLERANADMERLLYAASHDLKEPIRMVTSFLGLLEGKFAAELPDEAREYLGFAIDGGHRMKEMVTGLLSYAQVRQRRMEARDVDLGAIVEATLADLQVAIRDAGASLEVGELPTVRGDATRLRQVFQNLLSNALKFRGADPARIAIHAVSRETMWEIAIADNGIGFDPEYASRVFEMFQRLHSRGEYPGSGIGLAIVKEIVEQHGGRVRIESSPGRGTTVYFELPVKPA